MTRRLVGFVSLMVLTVIAVGCGLRQPVARATGLRTGMSASEVISYMGGEPAVSDVAGRIQEWHYCSTGTGVDRMVAIFFVDDQLFETVNYSVTLADTGGIYGSCDNFFKMGGYREPYRVTEIKRGVGRPPASSRTEDAREPETSVGTGTGFVVHPDRLILTASHVVEDATAITVSCNGQPPVRAAVTSSSPTVDLAVLTAAADLGTETFLTLSTNHQTALGDPVFTIGYPTPALLGRDAKYTNGTVSALSGLGGDASFLQISVPVQPGNSGGPLVNENGQVIGVVVATADAPAFLAATDSIPQNINWAVKSLFANALFTPPAGSAASTVDSEDVIAHVTEATCLVEATGAAR